MRALALTVVVIVGAGCTQEPERPPTETPTAPSSPSIQPLVLDVVADVTPEAFSDRATNSYLDGMDLAVRAVNADGGVDGRPVRLSLHDHRGRVGSAINLLESLVGRSLAILYVGPSAALVRLRAQVEEAGTPVVLSEGDLYTSRQLFRQVFQTTIPWAWQATVIARYLVRDRRARDIVFYGGGREGGMTVEAARAAVSYWGGQLAEAVTARSAEPRTGLRYAYVRAGRADAVMTFGEPLE
ncbi:MAG TPA: ABC transporter substrate-binding protein, partial [Actinomycetota bacterium]|nr:ABC transporter substrate-binding protein [Actinomycetota bacterium]